MGQLLDVFRCCLFSTASMCASSTISMQRLSVRRSAAARISSAAFRLGLMRNTQETRSAPRRNIGASRFVNTLLMSYPNVAHCRSCRSDLRPINSSRRTPSPEAIAAVIGNTLTTSDAETQKLRVEWDELVAQACGGTAMLDDDRRLTLWRRSAEF
jgi:hypothetical protein